MLGRRHFLPNGAAERALFESGVELGGFHGHRKDKIEKVWPVLHHNVVALAGGPIRLAPATRIFSWVAAFPGSLVLIGSCFDLALTNTGLTLRGV